MAIYLVHADMFQDGQFYHVACWVHATSEKEAYGYLRNVGYSNIEIRKKISEPGIFATYLSPFGLEPNV